MSLRNGAGPAPAATGGRARENVIGAGNARSPKASTQTSQAIRADLIGADLRWRRAGTGWRLLDGRRRLGDVVPDAKHPGMWRSPLSGGRFRGPANLSWAKDAVLAAAERELEWEARHDPAIAPRKCPENEGVFGTTSPPVRQNGAALGHTPKAAG